MNLNKVLLVGRLTQDPETRSTPSGQTVTTIRMATNRVWTNQGGQKQEAVEYHTVVAWGRLAEIASQYLKRGAMAMIEGRLQTRSWDDKTTGQKRYMTEIVAENLQLGPRAMGSGQGPAERGGSGEYRRQAPVPPEKQTPTAPLEDEIPIIHADELTTQGVEEADIKIKEEDLPF